MQESDACRNTPSSAYARADARTSSRLVMPEPARQTRRGAGLHVLLLALSLPVIGTLAAAMTWAMGGTFWEIVGATVAAWLLVQLIYFAQLVLRYLKLRDLR